MKLSRTWNAVLALSVLSASVASPVRADGPITTGVALASSIGGLTGGTTISDLFLDITSTATGLDSMADIEKRAIAQAALEDAAHYYETGELSGILPKAVTRIRELSPEMSKANDAEVVNLIVEAANRIAQ